MNTDTAITFAQHWINSWNSHDIDEIMSHYTEEIEFHSPFITLLKFNDTGFITNKPELRKYFEVGLNAYPDLHFAFQRLYTGTNTLAIQYTSVSARQALEVFEFNDTGKVVKVYCNYGVDNL